MKLIYTGGGYGGAWPHVPARDLSEAEIAALAEALNTSPATTAAALAATLVASGLYRKDEGGRRKAETTGKGGEGESGGKVE